MPTIQFRRGTAAQWDTANPVLASGEPGFETDTGRHKIGDGQRAWRTLDYFVSKAEVDAQIARAVAASHAVTSNQLTGIVVLTQAEYDATTPDGSVLYVVAG